MSEYKVGDTIIFERWMSWRSTDTRTGIIYSVISPTILVVETDNGKRFVVNTDAILSHSSKATE